MAHDCQKSALGPVGHAGFVREHGRAIPFPLEVHPVLLQILDHAQHHAPVVFQFLRAAREVVGGLAEFFLGKLLRRDVGDDADQLHYVPGFPQRMHRDMAGDFRIGKSEFKSLIRAPPRTFDKFQLGRVADQRLDAAGFDLLAAQTKP